MKNFLRPVVLLPLLTTFVFMVQFYTGFFIDPETQCYILMGINMVARIFTGRDIFTGEIKPFVAQAFDVPTKKLYESRVFWLLIIGFLGAIFDALNGIWHWGITFNVTQYAVPIISGITFFVGLVTKKPVTLK